MAQLDIREFESMPNIQGSPQIWPEPGKIDQPLAISGSSAQSSAFGPTTRYIVIGADSAFRYKVGSNPTATSSQLRVAADVLLVIGVQPGDKIAAITTT